MRHPFIACLLAAAPCWALAQPAQAPAPAAAEASAVVPQVERRPVTPPRHPSRDFEFGLFAGSYATQNFGTSAVYGLRLGYHITEDFFVQASVGRSKISDEVFRRIVPGGILPDDSQTLDYTSVSAGYNVLPGEIFIGRGIAKASAIYLLGGIGSTRFAGERQQTFHFGFGTRVLFSDRVAVQADVRDHVFSQDLLGERQSTHNLEVTLGLTVFF